MLEAFIETEIDEVTNVALAAGRVTRRVLLGLAVGIAQGAYAQVDVFPNRPIRIILPSAAGAGGDILARIMSEPLAKNLGQQILIDNRPGGSGNVAADATLKATADGYTLMQGNSSTHAMNQYLYSKAHYDPVRDFKPVAFLGSVPNMLIAQPALGIKSVGELIALARREPGKLTFASGGPGTSHHMAGELFRAMTGTDLVHVPSKGAAQGVAAVVAGDVSIMFPNIPSALGLIKQGRLAGIAVCSPQRISWLPEIPTVAENGLPGFEIVAWVAIFAPANTPDPVVQRLATAFQNVSALPEVREKLIAQGYEPHVMVGEAFQRFMRSESEKWGRIIRTAGVKIQ